MLENTRTAPEASRTLPRGHDSQDHRYAIIITVVVVILTDGCAAAAGINLPNRRRPVDENKTWEFKATHLGVTLRESDPHAEAPSLPQKDDHLYSTFHDVSCSQGMQLDEGEGKVVIVVPDMTLTDKERNSLTVFTMTMTIRNNDGRMRTAISVKEHETLTDTQRNYLECFFNQKFDKESKEIIVDDILKAKGERCFGFRFRSTSSNILINGKPYAKWMSDPRAKLDDSKTSGFHLKLPKHRNDEIHAMIDQFYSRTRR